MSLMAVSTKGTIFFTLIRKLIFADFEKQCCCNTSRGFFSSANITNDSVFNHTSTSIETIKLSIFSHFSRKFECQS